MFDCLQPADAPVIPGLEAHEKVLAKNQPEYNPLRVIISATSTLSVLSRWTLTPEQRAAIADGADIYLELMTFGQGFPPVRMAVGRDVDPEFIREQYGLAATSAASE